MNPFVVPAVILAIIIFFGVILLRRSWARNRLRGLARSRALSRLQSLASVADPHRRILEADAILDKALADLGYTGSMADKLRSAGKFLPGIEDIWQAHKLRNRLAHEPGTSISEREMKIAVAAFERAVLRLCR